MGFFKESTPILEVAMNADIRKGANVRHVATERTGVVVAKPDDGHAVDEYSVFVKYDDSEGDEVESVPRRFLLEV